LQCTSARYCEKSRIEQPVVNPEGWKLGLAPVGIDDNDGIAVSMTWRVAFHHENYLVAEIGLAFGPNPFAHITAFAIPQFPFL
jgi:hypothetical protein